MCGIAGLLQFGGAPNDWLRDNVTRMTNAVTHRGPDGGGIWIDAHAGIALGHRRLAIVDLTDAGSQPMTGASGRFVISFNGEIYNYRELRRSLESRGATFRSRTDTEVIPAAIEYWGLDAALTALDGMFAFGVWDRREGQLILARDRFGEKPLYYTQNARFLAFASDLAALEQLDGFDGSIDENVQSEFLERGYIRAPLTIFSSSRKLEAAHWMRAGGTPQRYWRVAPAERFTGSFQDATDELNALLRQAVRSRSVSDVRVGSFLSGGVDSSAVAAMTDGAQTFSIGFDDHRFDESSYAARVASHLDLPNTQYTATAADASRIIPKLAEIYSEPFADSSQIPTVLLSEIAGLFVKVALTGDGGDELFSGYPRYDQLSMVSRLPIGLRRAASSVLRWMPWGEKTQVLAQVMTAEDLTSMYESLMGQGARHSTDDALTWMALHDLENYFADDLLVKVDRAAMSVGLETRLPLLDPQLVTFALSLPVEFRRRKRVLKAVLSRYVPESYFQRPKQGFSVPLSSWLKGPLRDWAETLIPGITAQLPPGGRCVRIWSRLMLEAWLRRPSVLVRQVDPQSVSVVRPAGFA